MAEPHREVQNYFRDLILQFGFEELPELEKGLQMAKKLDRKLMEQSYLNRLLKVEHYFNKDEAFRLLLVDHMFKLTRAHKNWPELNDLKIMPLEFALDQDPCSLMKSIF